MQTRLQITLRGVRQSDALRDKITDEVRKLERFCDHLAACNVVIEVPQGNGASYSVCLEVTAPGKKFIVNREHLDDVYAAVHSAFQGAGHQLREHIAHKFA